MNKLVEAIAQTIPANLITAVPIIAQGEIKKFRGIIAFAKLEAKMVVIYPDELSDLLDIVEQARATREDVAIKISRHIIDQLNDRHGWKLVPVGPLQALASHNTNDQDTFDIVMTAPAVFEGCTISLQDYAAGYWQGVADTASAMLAASPDPLGGDNG